MKPEEIQKYAEDQKAAMKAVEEKIESAVTKEQLETVSQEMKTLNEKGQKDILEKLVAQGETIAKLEAKNIDNAYKTEASAIKQEIYDRKDEILKISSVGGSVTIKAPADITTGAQSLPSALPAQVGVQIAPPTNINLRKTFIDSVVTLFNTNQETVAYTDVLPKEGDFDYVAEGGLATQIDLRLETRFANVKKIAAYEKLTEEILKDIPRIQSIATDYLRQKHDLKRQNELLFGVGGANAFTGATVAGRLFVAGSMALQVPKPNFMDVLNACITDIYTTHNFTDEVSFSPNVAVINPTDFFINFTSAKDGDGKPLYPTASLFNRVPIGGLLVIPDRSIPTGKIFVADMSKQNVSNYEPYTVDIGYVNDDFLRGQSVIRGMSRFHSYIKNLDNQAFLYDDYATIKTAIATP